MPMSSWSRMWQWNIHFPGKSSNLTATRTLLCLGTFTESFQLTYSSGTPSRSMHLEAEAVQMERMVHADHVLDLPDLGRVRGAR